MDKSKMSELEMDEFFMGEALEEAKKAFENGEVPIGAVVVRNGKIIAVAHNMVESMEDSTSHAEVLVIRKAMERLGVSRLTDCTLYVTIEPCFMCAGAIYLSKLKRVVFGAFDPKGGALGSMLSMYDINGLNHYPMITSGVCAERCKTLIQEFFEQKRIRK